MKALLRKDLYVVDKQLRLLIVLALVLSVVPVANAVGSTYAIMISYMMPVSVVAYDEKCRWDKYAAMLPYTPRQIILSKYLLSYLLVVYSVLVLLLGLLVEALAEKEPVDPEDLVMVAGIGVACVLLNALCFPTMYRFGADKGRFFVMAALVVVLGGFLFLIVSPAGNAFLELVKDLPLLMLAAAAVVLLAALSVIAAHELLTAVCGAEKAKRWTALPAVTGALVIAAVYFSGEHYADSPAGMVLRWLIAAAVLALLLASVLTYGRPGALVLQDVCVMAVAGLVIPWAFSCMLQLRMLPHGAGMVLMPLVAAFCSDSAALFTGMACGRHKMAPLVSPHKTVEGALGGIAGGVVGMVIFRIVFYFCTLVPLHIGWCVVIGLAGALMGELGDLSFSVIKRQVGIKDYGRLLPGHGGVLDRFDSVLFAAPMIWMIVCTVQL